MSETTDNIEPQTPKAAWKWLVAPLLVLLLLAGVRWFLQSNLLMETLRSQLVKQASERLEGSLTIGELKGDLLFGVTVSEVELHDIRGDLVASVDSVRAAWFPMRVFRQPHEVEHLAIFGLHAEAVEDEEGRWNLAGLLPDDPDRPEDRETDRYWSLNRISLLASSASFRSPSLPDEQLHLTRIGLFGKIGVDQEGWNAAVHDLHVTLVEGRLDQPVEMGASGFLEGEEITLEHLLVQSGRSFLQGHFRMADDRQLDGGLLIDPFSWLDLRSYSDFPMHQDLDGSLSLGGVPGDFRIAVGLRAEAMQKLNFEVRMHLEEGSLKLSELELNADRFDGPQLTGLEQMPVLRSARLRADGEVSLGNWREGELTGTFETDTIRSGQTELDRLGLEFNWEGEHAELDLTVLRENQSLVATAGVTELFGELPGWNLELEGREVNPARLLDRPGLEGQFNFDLTGSGRGFRLGEELFTARIELFESRLGDQPLDRIDFDGRLSADLIAGEVAASIGSGRILADIGMEAWQEVPEYRFSAHVEEFNLEDLQLLEQLPTRLNARLEGSGRSFDLETMELTATARFDSSSVNFEKIETLRADIQISDGFVEVPSAELVSPVADAAIALRQHMLDTRNPENTLQVDAQIKDLMPLSPLLGVESIQATGEFSGRLHRIEEGELLFDSRLQLSGLEYDTLLTAQDLELNSTVWLFDDPEFELNLEIGSPVFQEIELHSISLASRSQLRDRRQLSGSLELYLNRTRQYSLSHEAEYELDLDELSVHLITSRLDLATIDGTLQLQESFGLSWSDETLRLEPLAMQSDVTDSWIRLEIPRLDSLNQEVRLDAGRIHLGSLQQYILEEEYGDAWLSGQIDFRRTPGDIETDLSLLLEEISYREGEFDSLKVDVGIIERRLTTRISGWHDESEIVRIDGNVPFEPGDPLQFDDEFFERPVRGTIQLRSIPAGMITAFLGEERAIDADGSLTFESDIAGTAGYPTMTGRLSVMEGSISGVAFDLIDMEMDYRHESADIRLEGGFHARGSRLAQFTAHLPLYLDLRAFQVDLPDEEDEVFVSFYGEELDLALVNEFLSPDRIRNVRGRLSGTIELTGPIAELEPRGELTIRNGALRVVDAGITIDQIRSDFQIQPDEIVITTVTGRSGPGRFTLEGTLALEHMQPGELNARLRATQFRAANSPDLNAVVDLDTRLRGTFESPDLIGTLRVRSGFVNLRNFGERAVEDVELEIDEERERISFYEQLAAEVNVIFDRRFFIQNRELLDMEVELAGSLDLIKEPGQELEMFGSIEGVQGYARPMGRRFQLEEAMVSFHGPIRNPDLNIRTRYRPPQSQEDITLWYIIEGSVDDPSFRFDSEPFLELQDIISYTLFGRPFHALDSWQQTVSEGSQGPGVTDIALDLLLDRAGMIAAQQLGIDVVQIDTNRTGSGSTTTVKTGWYLTDRTFFAMLNEIGGTSPKTLFMIEYMLRRNLELIVTQGDDSREGVDLRWRFDY